MRNEHQSPQNQTEPRAGRLRALAADLVYDALGSILFALGVYTFAKSADFAPGGVTGLALILNHLWRWPIGTTTLALNIPIILLSCRVVGRKFLFKSFRTMMISTFFLDLVFPHTPAYTGSPLLAAVFSGVFMGAGLALVYMRGSSTGGTDFLIFTVKKLRPHFSMGQVTLLIDLSVILLGGIFFRNIDALLYGAICTYAQSLVIDKVMYGAGSGKLAIQSAVNVATDAIDCIHTTAASHGRIFIVEVMGHKVGWLTLNAGIAGGADIILIPEIPYDIDKLAKKIKARHNSGSHFTILAVAEGAISKEDAKLSKKEYKKKLAKRAYPSVSYEIADELGKRCGLEVRVTVPGHTQRGGSPCPYDRVFASRLGSEAGKLILKNEYGFMVGYKNREIVKVPLEEVAGKLKMVDPDSSIVKEAKLLGISFGD